MTGEADAIFRRIAPTQTGSTILIGKVSSVTPFEVTLPELNPTPKAAEKVKGYAPALHERVVLVYYAAAQQLIALGGI